MATTFTAGPALSRLVISGAESTTCSKLSTSSRSFRSARYAPRVSSSVSPGTSRTARAWATAGATSDGSRTEASEVDEDAVVELVEHIGAELQRQPRLADASGAGEGERGGPPLTRQVAKPLQLLLAADERIGLDREVRRPVSERPRRWELGRQAVDEQLVELLRLEQVLQPVLTEVDDVTATAQQSPRGSRQEHLTAVRRSGDARDAMDVETHVVAVEQARFTRVEAHPHAKLGVCGPLVRRERALRVRRGGCGVRGSAKA